MSQVLFSQYLKELANNPSFYEINQEKPDDFIKLAIIIYV
jgi:hypothetical protein